MGCKCRSGCTRVNLKQEQKAHPGVPYCSPHDVFQHTPTTSSARNFHWLMLRQSSEDAQRGWLRYKYTLFERSEKRNENDRPISSLNLWIIWEVKGENVGLSLIIFLYHAGLTNIYWYPPENSVWAKWYLATCAKSSIYFGPARWTHL